MKKYNFNKLIRSNLPERMKKEGVALFGRHLTDEEFAKELKNKLVEEASPNIA
jgi:predicted house-cleaning noncanonical NTP pyrophosphatase (MazG superfamily)